MAIAQDIPKAAKRKKNEKIEKIKSNQIESIVTNEATSKCFAHSPLSHCERRQQNSLT